MLDNVQTHGSNKVAANREPEVMEQKHPHKT